MTETPTWTLSDRGRELAVETWVADRRNHARLLVDGEEAATGDTDAIGDVKLSADATHVKVGFWWRGRVGSCDLFDRPDGAEPPGEEDDPFKAVKLVTIKVPFAPPPGTRAARTHAWREAHPELWAARHVAIEVGSILLVVLGVSALVGALVNRLIPSIDWSWLPSVSAPEWLRYVNPGYWIGRILPDWDWFGWVPDLPEINLPDLGWVKYVVILGIAIATGVREVRKRRAREQREAETAAPVEAAPVDSGDDSADRPGPADAQNRPDQP